MTAKPQACLNCALWRGCRSYRVPSEGFRNEGNEAQPIPPGPADILFVGKAPGQVEDDLGRLYMGDPGVYLRDWASCWDGSYALTTVVKCRPERDRDPESSEIMCCEAQLTQDISEWQPKVIVALGLVAIKTIWPGAPDTVSKARQSPVKLGNVWVVPTFDPSNHTSGRKNLDEEYKRVLEICDRIIKGQFDVASPDIRMIESEEDLAALYRQIGESLQVCFDVEWDAHEKCPGKETYWAPDAKPICLAIATHLDQPIWVAAEKYMGQVTKMLAGKTIIGQNVKGDLNILAWFYCRDIWDLIQDHEDIMLWHASRDQGKAGNGLVPMAVQYRGMSDWKKAVWDLVDEETARRSKAKDPETRWNQATLADIPYSIVAEMCAKDVFATLSLYEHFQSHPELAPSDAYRGLMLEASDFLGRLELRGLGIDPAMQQALQTSVEQKVAEIQSWLESRVEVQAVVHKMEQPAVLLIPAVEGLGQVTIKHRRRVKKIDFNGNSPIHCEFLLRETDLLVEEKVQRTCVIEGEIVQQSKQDKKTMAELGKAHPVWEAVRVQNMWKDLLSKFIYPYPKYRGTDGRIHADFVIAKCEGGSFSDDKSAGTDSGRLACRRPALHNIKKHDEEFGSGRLLRMMFGPTDPNNWMYEGDAGQGEPRVIAVLAGDEELIRACGEGDLYRNFSGLLWHKSPDAVTAGERKMMKQGFLAAVMYGQSDESFAEQHHTPLHEAHAFLTGAKRRFKRLVDWREFIIECARAGKAIVTPFGRETTCVYTGDRMLDGHMDRKAVNFAVQATLSDIVLSSARRIDQYFRRNHIPVWFVNLIHDSHICEVSKDLIREIIPVHKRMMEDTDSLPIYMPVAMPCEFAFGPTMGRFEKWAA